MRFVRCNARLSELIPTVRPASSAVIIVWGYQAAPGVVAFAEQRELPIYRMEDGFVRSTRLGADHVLPRSLVLDKSARLYFDAGGASDLETILASYDFAVDSALMRMARACRARLLELGLSKYNNVGRRDADAMFSAHAPRDPLRRRILVIGQVEDDASLIKGHGRGWSNLDLARATREENPNADIFFKPHPDYLDGHTKRRINRSTLEEIEPYAHVLGEPLALVDSFACIEHVYTLTSLSGFEAVLRGLPVTVFGMPFYAGWGLTDDRQQNTRRNRKLCVDELFAGAYLLYPKYFSPPDAAPSDLERTLEEIASELAGGEDLSVAN